MKSIFWLSAMILLLAACTTGETSSMQKVSQKSAEIESIAAETTAGKTSSLEQLEADTIAKNDATKNLVIPAAIVKGSIGETAIFGAMFNRANLQGASYFAKVLFIEARDKNYGKIEVDRNMIKAWTASETPNISLADEPSRFVPITFTIGNEVMPGAATVPGTYQFEVTLYKRVDASFSDDVKGAIKQIYLKVE